MTQLWGIDLGGTKIEGVVIEGGVEPAVARVRLPTEAHLGYEQILSQVEKLVALMEQETLSSRPEIVGIGTPGTVDPSTGLMKNCNTTALNGRPFPKDLERLLGVQLRIANDANCFALAEAKMGAARGEGVVFGIIMGTGVGGGLVVRGQVIDGAQGIAGEWGHNVLDPEGEQCYCGKRGCVETVLSGPALERFYERLTGTRKSLFEIVEIANDDSAAEATIARLISEFGRAAAVIINILDPDVLVLGGGVGNVAALMDGAVAALKSWVFNDSVRTKVVRPTLGDSAGVFGAAMLAAGQS